MVLYSEAEQQLINSIFSSLFQHELEYVVPRSYQELPERVTGGDIDVIIRPDELDTAAAICDEQGLSKRETAGTQLAGLAHRTIQDPRHAVRVLFSRPQQAFDELRSAVQPETNNGDQLAAEYTEQKYEQGNLIIHFMNHVAYTSPHNNATVRVDPTVEEFLYQRSRTVGGIPAPAPPDELAHLICRGIFDYGGRFPEHYIKRCDELQSEVLADNRWQQAFEDLLSLLFFDADGVVLDNVEEGSYDTIRDDLVAFAEY